MAKKKKKEEIEDLSREQAIVDEAKKTEILNRLKSYLHDDVDFSAFSEDEVRYIAKYHAYLVTQINGYKAGLANPPDIRDRDWVQKDIQIIMRESGPTNFQEKAKIINLSGNILVHRSVKGYIQAILEEAPDDMRFTLIEEKPRVQKKGISAVVDEKRVTILFDDNSTETVEIVKPSKDEWQ